MGWLKPLVKQRILGEPGLRPRDVSRGLLRGLRFHVDTSSKAMRLLGLDEREIAGHVRRFAQQARSAIDVGANDGWYSLYFCSVGGIERVYAVEPLPEERARIESNFALNDPALRDKLTLVGKYLGSQEATCSTIDAAFPDLPRPVLMKIDVDGAELRVLQGARNTLAAGEVFLVVETHSPALERDCQDFLRALGYHTRVVKNGWYRLFLPEQRWPADHNRWFVAEKALAADGQAPLVSLAGAH